VRVRRETSAESAARFFEIRRHRRIRVRETANRRRRDRARASTPTVDTIRISLVRSILPVDLVRAAAWIPDSPVTRALTERPIVTAAWPTMPFSSNAMRLRQYRADAVARGDCYACRCRPVKPGTRYCSACIQRAADYADSIAYKKCQTCGVALNGRRALLCERCTASNTAHGAKVAAGRKAQGICVRCGKRESFAGAAQCLVCLDNMRDRVLAVTRAQGRKPRPCPVCRELGIDGTGHDSRTHDRWMERGKRWAPEAA